MTHSKPRKERLAEEWLKSYPQLQRELSELADELYECPWWRLFTMLKIMDKMAKVNRDIKYLEDR